MQSHSTQKDTSSSAVTSSLSDLIARLEKATGPDRAIDGLIKALVNPPPSLADEPASIFVRYDRNDDLGVFKTDHATQLSFKTLVPPYTSSIDAAMTLKPGYHKYILGSEWCAVWQEDGRYNDAERVPTRNRPAIALCIAALKAQLSTRDDAAIATRTDAVVADIALDALTDAGLRVVSGTAIESTAELLAAYEAQIFILEKKCNDLRGVTK